ncbi:MAG: ArpU family phage packaging/lysis transcriptional regulator [Enterococcus avium]
MALLPEVDANNTKMSARKILSQYRKWERIAGKAAIDIKSPLLSDMPRTLGVSINKPEDGLLERVYAENERDAILRALDSLSWRSRKILAMTYCEPEKASVYEISLELHFSEVHVKRLRHIALLEFAEAYKHGQCLVYKK